MAESPSPAPPPTPSPTGPPHIPLSVPEQQSLHLLSRHVSAAQVRAYAALAEWKRAKDAVAETEYRFNGAVTALMVMHGLTGGGTVSEDMSRLIPAPQPVSMPLPAPVTVPPVRNMADRPADAVESATEAAS